MTQRVFVTGAGIVSALGIGQRATLNALLENRSGVGTVRYLPTVHEEFPVGEVPMSNTEMSQILGASYPATELRTVLMGCLAARETVENARLTADDISRAAFISGTTVGGMDNTERHFAHIVNTDANAKCPSRKEIKYNDCGYSTQMIADYIGRFRTTTTTSTACSSAANAIILGANMIKAGIADIVVAGGSESLSRFHLNGFNSLMILDKNVCRPFDMNRQGINLGEGAGYIVLESEASVRRRDANISGVLSGYANTCDAYHQTATSENGEGAYRSMRKAMDMARLTPSDIDYINAHGTGTPNNDLTELAAMQRIWDHHLPPFSSTKALTGHTTSASGAIESVLCLLMLRHGFIPCNAPCTSPIDEDAMPVQSTQRNVQLRNIINNSFGFGGNDSTLIFSRYDMPS